MLCYLCKMIYICLYLYIYIIYIYIYVCVCVSVCVCYIHNDQENTRIRICWQSNAFHQIRVDCNLDKLGHHCFGKWLVARAAPGHYLYQHGFIVSWSLMGNNSNDIGPKTLQLSVNRMDLKIASVKWWPFCPSLSLLKEKLNTWYHTPNYTLSLKSALSYTFHDREPLAIITGIRY